MIQVPIPDQYSDWKGWANALVQELLRSVSTETTIPVGTVGLFAGAIPQGWILCNGEHYSVSTFPTLSVYLGTTYNSPVPPVGRFRVPNTPVLTLSGVNYNVGIKA